VREFAAALAAFLASHALASLPAARGWLRAHLHLPVIGVSPAP